MKRVLIFSLNYYPFVGGAEVAIKEITDRIPVEEIEFHLIAYHFDSTLPRVERIGNVWVHRVGFGKKRATLNDTFSWVGYLAKIFYVPFAALKGIFLHRKNRFDGAWAMMSYMMFPIVLMRMVGLRLPYALTLQEGDPFEYVFKRVHIQLFSPLLFYGIRHASVVQVISTYLGSWARTSGYTGQVHIIPNGVDVQKFSGAVSLEDIAHKRADFNTSPGDTLLVTTSRLVHKNAVDDVIRALPLLPETVRFVVYGIGPAEEMLRELASKLAVENRVYFKGQIAHDEMPLALKACDIFIRPSRSEGMGNSFVEAFAAGIPVIATPVGGIPDFLFDPVANPDKPSTGIFCEVDNPASIATAIQKYLADPALTQKIVENAHSLAIEKYDWNIIADHMKEEIFDTLG